MNRPTPRMARTRGALVAGRKDWYRIENFVDRPDTAAIYVYDEIGYWGVTAADFVRDLTALQVANIDLHINSPGGECFEGIAIHSAIQAHPANVTVYIDGLAASAASFIAMAGDTIKIARNAQMMIHDASGLCIGPAADMRQMADLLDKLSDNIADMYLQQAGGTVEAWREAMLAETWFSADEALAAGLVDEIIGADMAEPADPEGDQGDGQAEAATADATEETEAVTAAAVEPEAEWDLSIFRYGSREQAPAPALAALAAPAAAPVATVGLATGGVVDRAAIAEAIRAEFGDLHLADLPAVTDWDELIAHLTGPDPWGDQIAHLISTPSSAATDA